MSISTGSGAWLDFQGLIRATMVSGDVDVTFADFRVVPQQFTWCQTAVSVPEPSVVTFAGVAVAIAIARKTVRPGNNITRPRWLLSRSRTRNLLSSDPPLR